MVDFVSRARAVIDAAVVGRRRPLYPAKIAAFFRSLNIWFWAVVGLPTLIAGVYFFAIASDLYLSEVKFVVHGPAKGPSSALTAMLESAAASAVSEDTYAVHEYLMSRDAVRRLEREDDLRTLLGRPEGDLISRFPGAWFWRKDFLRCARVNKEVGDGSKIGHGSKRWVSLQILSSRRSSGSASWA